MKENKVAYCFYWLEITLDHVCMLYITIYIKVSDKRYLKQQEITFSEKLLMNLVFHQNQNLSLNHKIKFVA